VTAKHIKKFKIKKGKQDKFVRLKEFESKSLHA
jgi:hypothetical protein